MSNVIYRRLWSDNRLNGLVLFLEPGTDIDTFTADLRARLTDFPTTQVNPRVRFVRRL